MGAPDLVLHHYPPSPFSEKVRLILGFKRLAWKSVHIPMIMPKPDVVALTGGYRKTPILQIGRDIFCDTALIADVLDRKYPTPSLYPESVGALARIVAQWADTTLFWTMIPYAFQPVALPALFENATPEHIQAFIADRKPFRANVPRMPVADATRTLHEYLSRLEGTLVDGRAHLFGASPTIADFSTYHSIWFIRRAGPLAGILDAFPRLSGWADRIKDIGHGAAAPLSSAAAIEAARTAPSPTAAAPGASAGGLDEVDGIRLGERVRVTPTDYGIDPVEGTLESCRANEVGVRRSDPRAGEVVVHFPRIGFAVSRAE